MDLNVSPQPEEDEEIFEPNISEDSAPDVHQDRHYHAEAVSAVEISRRVLHLLLYLFIYFWFMCSCTFILI